MKTAEQIEIFVFGSNMAGIHGKGAALYAKKHYGAVTGVGTGLTGRAYAIPTKTAKLIPRSLGAIRTSIINFKIFASSRPDLKFKVTRVGCGLAGYKDYEIAFLFEGSPENCYFDPAWGARLKTWSLTEWEK